MDSTTLATYKQRLNEAAERAGPEQGTTIKVLAGELRAAHRDAIRERDTAAASLHRDHGWTYTKLCIEIHGRPSKVAAVRAGVEAVAGAPKLTAEAAETAFRAAQERVEGLWGLYKQAKELEKNAGASQLTVADAAAELQLPADPHERVKAAMAQLETVNAEYDTTIEMRNRGAAALIDHAGWSKRQAAQLAGVYVGRLYDYEGTTQKTEADPDRVVELAAKTRRLDALKKALMVARDSAIRELARTTRPADLAREYDLSDERIVQIRDAQNV
jgi:hypothetical protein